jgi:ABC-type polysaccharide/polyol phosphate export permease
VSSTYFPLEHPLARTLNAVNPLFHLAEAFRGVLLGGPVGVHLGALALLVATMLVVLVPLDLRLLRRRVLGE